jgi:ankyrin repeat protein
MLNDYWTAIRDADAPALRALLSASPDSVHTPISSSPWRVAHDPSYAHQTMGVHVCSLAGREPLLAVLLAFAPDLEVVTFEENKGLTTPLVLAAWEGALESCRLLLEAGANPNTCASAESPLYAAAEHHAWDKVELLTAHGARHDIFTAAICGQLAIVKAEVAAYGPLLHRRSTKRHRTPLEDAIEHGQAEVAEFLRGSVRAG